MFDYDCETQMNRCLMAIAEGADSDSLADSLLAECERVEMNGTLLAAAASRVLSVAHTRLATFEYHGRESLADAKDLEKAAEDLFLFASTFFGQAEYNVRRLREEHARAAGAEIIPFPGGELA